MTRSEQLKAWVAGRSVHATIGVPPDENCCPDFSCCIPELLQPEHIRREFVAAPSPQRMYELLDMFIKAANDWHKPVKDNKEPLTRG